MQKSTGIILLFLCIAILIVAGCTSSAPVSNTVTTTALPQTIHLTATEYVFGSTNVPFQNEKRTTLISSTSGGITTFKGSIVGPTSAVIAITVYHNDFGDDFTTYNTQIVNFPEGMTAFDIQLPISSTPFGYDTVIYY
jgi:hypothetical protein